MKKILVLALLLALIAAAFYYFSDHSAEQENNQPVTSAVKKGEFTISVLATGELQAKKSVKIRAPEGMRSAGIWQTTIDKLIPEGTVVESGDFVASLDKSQIADKISQVGNELDKVQSQLDQMLIDTAIEMNGMRDQMANLKFAMKEKKLQVEQSRYEPQMVIRQAELDLERSQRDFDQLITKVDLKRVQNEAKVLEIQTTLKQSQSKLDKLMKLTQDFNIKAPEGGMLIYSRNWDGSKKLPGAQISSWNSTVAELPDLSDMISKTFVNEVDVSKVRVNQKVNVKVDAFPELTYKGEVIAVANIGEERRDFDTKVFEVTIQLYDNDTLLRPAMTTGNEVITYVYKDVKYIPLEALHVDSVSFAYVQNEKGNFKKEVITGESNNEGIIILHGLEEKEEVYLSIPKDADSWTLQPLDTEVKQEYLAQKAAEKEARLKSQKEAEEAAKLKTEALKQGLSAGGGSGGDVIVVFE